MRPTVYQGMYSALTRDVEKELLPAIRALGMRFYAYNPLGGGLLTDRVRSLEDVPATGRFSDATNKGAKYRARFYSEPYMRALVGVQAASKLVGVPTHVAALRWIAHPPLLRFDLGDAVVVGASTLAQLKENLDALVEGGPLPVPWVIAADAAWDACKDVCPSYFR